MQGNFRLEDRTALVTGGSDGIGKEIAFGLACRGIHVIIVGRDALKGDAAVAELQSRSENKRVEFVAADLSSVQDTGRLGKLITARWQQLHYLVHSAGSVRGAREITADGVESNFAVNYLSRFQLTLELLPLLQSVEPFTQPGRIVIVGGAANIGKVHFDDVNLAHRFSLIRSVLQFQCANDIFTLELARRMNAAAPQESRVSVNILKYGVVKTNIRKNMPLWLKAVSAVLDPFMGQTAKQAAVPALKLLLDSEFEHVSGAMFLCTRRFARILPRTYVADPSHGARLWQLSEELARIQNEAVRLSAPFGTGRGISIGSATTR